MTLSSPQTSGTLYVKNLDKQPRSKVYHVCGWEEENEMFMCVFKNKMWITVLVQELWEL